MTVIRNIVISAHTMITGNVVIALSLSVTIATSTKKPSTQYIPAAVVGSASVLSVWLICADMKR